MVEKNAKRDVDAVEAFVGSCCAVSSVGTVGRLRNFTVARSGDAARDDSEGGDIAVGSSKSSIGNPTATGSELPLNHPLRPPFDLSAILI